MSRKNTNQKKLIDMAIDLYDLGRKNDAITMLEDAGIPDATIARVLKQPEQRRHDSGIIFESRYTGKSY